ncbi:endonuclease/exonuclease/phosphatase family protein [Phaeovulum vinaykumarii]|uniref:Metal-dependent hydrolase, endonuclease/exonuclease/phosphatase family n=1 Tax=Phaeovulum vinaykumarii TaxID=407234 RepID=A0A1N7K5E4_9RHOB|nr:endonuclease/exonuclease/phosphatase family protein [Phaeovulum vinaykumarii]SIS56788.1 Metal-dependent hydrolase, endonuclease/exonuclease/phosphatase family [Phaeovulum vinaykumarii]SOB93169.1 endonuclease/exonuclease/phosphatase family metal-dependent hydrolase [Phaeovulum vinaykumarii]
MRLATYNVEWFAGLFDRRGHLLEDDEWSARYNVTRAEQLTALGIVFTALDADAVLVVEAPEHNRRRHTVPMLERFARHYGLRTRRAVIGFVNHTQQEIALLYDPDRLSARHDPLGPDPLTGAGAGESVPRFDGTFRIDLDIDARLDSVQFSKPPLELALRTAAGTALRLIGVHVKSKAPHGATSEDAAVRIAIENRRKQLAQCIWLRGRVDAHLDRGDSLIVLGDFNDGPGLDEYEKLFGRSGLEIVIGEGVPPERRLFDPHAVPLAGTPLQAAPSTARFYRGEQAHYFSALLDFILISPDLMAHRPRWRIWHPFDDPACHATPELRDALLQASDHFPVTLDLEI